MMAAAVAQAVVFGVILVRATILRPFGDMISWIDAYQEWPRHGSFAAYLWLPHNEHHMVIIRLLTAVDVSVFHAGGLVFVVAGCGALLTTSWLFLAALRRDPALVPAVRPLAWLAPMLTLNAAAVADCGIPINTVYPMALLFIVLAAVLFDGEAEPTGHTAARRLAALLAASLAGLANGVGLSAWPAMLWVAWRGGAAAGWLGLIATAGASYILIYLWTLPAISHVGASQLGAAHLAKMALYLLDYLALPVSRVRGFAMAAHLLGGAMLAAGTIGVWTLSFGRTLPGRTARIGGGLMIVTLVSAMLAAIGRVDMAPSVLVPLRYCVIVTPLHVGLLAVALPYVARHATTQRSPIRLRAAALAFALFLLAFQALKGATLVAATDALSAMLDRFDAGIREPAMTRVIFPDLAMAKRVVDAARRQN